MKNIFRFILLFTTFLTLQLQASFNFGSCSGSGTFEQEIIYYNSNFEQTALVGTIPKGIQGLHISLISDKDVDIRLYGENDDKIVHWPYGILNLGTEQTKPYKDVNITYSGYNGAQGQLGHEFLGHEFIEVDGATPTVMTMKAFGYKAGYATVNYSWTGKVGCTSNQSGSGSFTQTLEQNATSLVGTIPPNVNNVKINLTSATDLDIQLYGADGTAIASWKPAGLLAGATKQSILYNDMNITWSGYNGVGGQLGHEYITITPNTTEVLVMKVFGYKAGEANVTYSWGDAIKDVLASGDIINTPVTEEELIQATLDEIEASKTFLQDAKNKIFNLKEDGTAKDDGSSLTSIDWNPTHDASMLLSTLGKNSAFLYTNAVTNDSKTIYKKEIAILGEKANANYMVFGSNPLRNTINDDMNEVLKNSMSWLTKRENLNSTSFKVVIAHLDDSRNFRDERTVRTWLNTNYGGNAQYNSENTCDDTALSTCLDASTDLLIISQVSNQSDNMSDIATTVNQALSNGISVLYIHHDGNLKSLGKELFSSVFDVTYIWDNYWRKLKLEDYSPTGDMNVLSDSLSKIQTMFTHFKNEDYNFDWSSCKNSRGNMDENNDKCNDVVGLNSEFQDGASAVRQILNALDGAKKNIFTENGYTFQKLLALTSDKFRQSVSYPMDKVRTDNNEFMRSYYSDHAIYNYRAINPVQPNMGNFSRSDFSHITPTTRTVNLTSKKSFRSTGAYALPGQTVKVTRNDSSDLVVKVRINTLRSGATHQYQKNGYKRPKYLTTQYFELKKDEAVEFTSPYGGTLQLSFDKNDLPVQVTFKNVGEHPYWASTADNASFAAKMSANEYDWAEIATSGFEVHSKIEKMKKSIADPKWGSAEALAAGVYKYTSNYPHVLAGFKGDGIDVVAEIHDWASEKNISIEVIDKMKHMNADQATCGYGCSGNPYDAYWAFGPIRHGDIHEMGHSMQKKRFEGFENHAATNTFSYYTKAKYFENVGKDPSCQKLPFKSLFDTIQSSVGESNITAFLKTNLWDTISWKEPYILKMNVMMHAQKLGKLQNGWHVLARVHILEREMSRAKADWKTKKDSLGFSTYTLKEINAIRNNDWLIVAYSYASELDLRNYFDMMGIPHSDKAYAQIATFGFDVAPNSLFVSTSDGYCKTDEYGTIFDRPTLAIDGSTSYPY